MSSGGKQPLFHYPEEKGEKEGAHLLAEGGNVADETSKLRRIGEEGHLCRMEGKERKKKREGGPRFLKIALRGKTVAERRVQ